MRRGPKPGSGGRPKKAVRTVRVCVRVTEAARAEIDRSAAECHEKPGEWLSRLVAAETARRPDPGIICDPALRRTGGGVRRPPNRLDAQIRPE